MTAGSGVQEGFFSRAALAPKEKCEPSGLSRFDQDTEALWEYAGVIHSHSHFSDGSGSIATMIEEAEYCGLAFLVVTDHNTLLAREILGEGWYGRVLLLIGEEISPPRNHYLALGTHEPIGSRATTPEGFLAEVRRQGGVGFLAHPHDRGNVLFSVPAFCWEVPEGRDCQGLEVWNFYSDVGYSVSTWWRVLLALVAPWLILSGPFPSTLALWDREGLCRRFSGIGGADAHGIHLYVMGRELVVGGYRWFFRGLRTHILTPRPLSGSSPSDLEQVLDALTRGSCFVSLDSLQDGTGFRFFFRGRDGSFLSMGAEADLPPGGGWLHVQVPGKGITRVLRDGALIAESQHHQTVLAVKEVGVYRTEVLLRRWGRWRTWILSNPIYLRG